MAGAVAIAGGAVGVAVSGSGVYAENKIGAATEAYIDGDGTGITADNITVSAKNSSAINAIAGAASVAAAFGATGLAVSIAISLAQNDISGVVEAHISNADNLVEATDGDISVRAEDNARISVISAAAASKSVTMRTLRSGGALKW